jgi:RHS repeat-associated protein
LTQTYGYDGLNRLQSASENGTAWQQTYDCDRFGNRAVRATSYIPSPQLTPQSASLTDFSAFDQFTNRLSVTKYPQVLYDFAGNLKRDQAGSTFTYDGESRQVSASVGGASASYSYDGDGRRVKKVVGTVTTVFVYNASGQMVAEYVSDPVPPPAGGGGTSYLTSDHLGSTRVVTKADGSVKARYDYLPFGEELPASIGGRSSVVGYGGADSMRQKFTAKERDSESGLDYFLARYYSSAQGRFTSVDPAIRSAVLEMPQSWNRYIYVINNPLILTDPNGKVWVQDKKGIISWRNGDDIPDGYTRVANGTQINNVQGATGQYEQYNGHNITFNADGTITDRGLYALLPTPVPDLPDKSGEIGWALIQFEALSVQGAGIILSGGLTGLAVLEGSAFLTTTIAGEARDGTAAGTTRDISGGELTPEQALDAAEKYLGPGYKEIAPGVFRSDNGTGSKQFRMTSSDLTDPKQGAHVHFEYIGPDGKQIVENSHVKIIDPPRVTPKP